MRFGLVGTGHWAQHTHAVALQSSQGCELRGVFGRSAPDSSALARALRIRSYVHYDEMLADVDAVAFAVAPHAQAALAVHAARAGKHLLLERPLAFTTREADEIVAAVDASGSASVVFFTWLFRPEVSQWLERLSERELISASGAWLSPALRDAHGPWAGSAWRWERGALWDLGAHALSLLLPTMGPVASLHAQRGRGDLVHLMMQHDDARVSSTELSLRVPPAAAHESLVLRSEHGIFRLPRPRTSAVEALRLAVVRLRDAATSGTTPAATDVRFGREVVRVLELADERRVTPPHPTLLQR